MLFTTVEFSIFFFVTFLLAAATATRSLPFRLVLTIASYVFYGWSDWRYAFLLFECSLVNYLLGICLMSATSKKSKKSVLMIGVLANISLLFYFKYFSFLASNLNINLSWNIALPIGISFYTFQAISYLVDIYKQKIPPATSFVDFLLFKSFFPQLIAGPLVRASEMLPQLNSRTFMTKINLTAGLTRIAIGLVKKVIIAHYLATNLVDPVFAHPGNYSSQTLLIAAYGYAAQIYCDFSGYCDMAIGIAILLGFKFPENFNQPYRAHSLQDFWRRWHITLGRFFRDYVYIPLGGSKTSELVTARNLLITMLLGGIWHGANWTFVTWGALHGVGLALERLGSVKSRSILKSIWSPIVTFHFVVLTWIFFRAESNVEALNFIRTMLTWSRTGLDCDPTMVSLTFGAPAMHLLPSNFRDSVTTYLSKLPVELQALTVATAVMAIVAIAPAETPPFIYFKF